MHLQNRPVVFLLIFFAFSEGVSGSQSQLEWITPSAGDMVRPGDDIVGQWKADKAVVSPSFQLCLGSSQSSVSRRSEDDESGGTCGAKVYPTVQQNGGVYSISLTAPNTTSEEPCYLLMQDDFGDNYRSPSFSVSEKSKNAVSPQSPDAQSPIGISMSSSPTVTVIPVIAPDTVTTSDTAYTSRRSPPVAAFAVPLSIIGAILLVAGGLCLRHNKKLQEERIRDLEKLTMARRESCRSIDSFTSSRKSAYSRQSDIEHALSVLSKHDLAYSPKRDAPVPVPLFMPVDYSTRREREPRRSTREPYTLSRGDTYTQRHYRTRSSKQSTYSSSSHRGMSMPVPSPGPASSCQSSITLCPSSRAPSVVTSSRPHSRATAYSTSPSTEAAPYSFSSTSTRPHSRASRNSRPCLPPIYTGAPLYSSSHREGEGHVTESVLDDYLLPSPHDHEGAPAPPTCLIPAPQRLHVRNTGPVSREEGDEEERMEDVDLYDAVASNLRRGHVYM